MAQQLKKFVWDTSAIINIKEPDNAGDSPGHSLIKDLTDGWISGPYLNIFPSLAVFEVSATVSRMHRDGKCILREFYLMDENAVLYDVDRNLISKSDELFPQPGFDQLRGADIDRIVGGEPTPGTAVFLIWPPAHIGANCREHRLRDGGAEPGDSHQVHARHPEDARAGVAGRGVLAMGMGQVRGWDRRLGTGSAGAGAKRGLMTEKVCAIGASHALLWRVSQAKSASTCGRPTGASILTAAYSRIFKDKETRNSHTVNTPLSPSKDGAIIV